MDRQRMEKNEAKIFRNATQRISNLMKLKRFQEASVVAVKLGAILRLWGEKEVIEKFERELIK